MMAAPVSNHLVSGTLKDRLGDILKNTTVTLTHVSIERVLTKKTGSDGKFIFNLGSLSSQWSVGQNITLSSTVALKGTISSTVEISSGVSQTVDLQLAETSDLVFAENSQNRYNLNFALITNYAGEPYTSLNPLPVNSSEIDLLFNPQHEWTITDQDGQPDDETVTLSDGTVFKRTFTYTTVQGARLLTLRSRWQRQ